MSNIIFYLLIGFKYFDHKTKTSSSAALFCLFTFKIFKSNNVKMLKVMMMMLKRRMMMMMRMISAAVMVVAKMLMIMGHLLFDLLDFL